LCFYKYCVHVKTKTKTKKKHSILYVYEWEAELGAAPGHLSLAHFIQLVHRESSAFRDRGSEH